MVRFQSGTSGGGEGQHKGITQLVLGLSILAPIKADLYLELEPYQILFFVYFPDVHQATVAHNVN